MNAKTAVSVLLPLVPDALDHRSKPGVSARILYAFLELNPAAWARWTKKNIVSNPYAIEYTDWEGFQPDVENRVDTSAGGRPTQDYALSLDFAKRLAMMARSAKGEEARQYFLDCERQALAGQSALSPRITQAHVSLSMAKALVEIEERQDVLEATQKAQALEIATLKERQPPEGRMTTHQFIKAYSKPYLPKEVLDAFKYHCRRMEESIMFRPDGQDHAFPYYTLGTLTLAYGEATRQLSFLAERRA